ncbi:hypothetical protein JCM10207_000442 [Rhodosporidiobolus poonsookiae]
MNVQLPLQSDAGTPDLGDSLAVALLPPVWAVLLLTISGVRWLRRRRGGRIRLAVEDDPSTPRQKSLFTVFVEDEDILTAAGVPSLADGAEEPLYAAGEAVLPPPPLAIALVPLLEAVGWAGALLFLFAQRAVPPWVVVAYAGHALAWLYAFLAQLGRRSATAPLSLLSLYVCFLLDTAFALVQQARASRTADFPSSAFLFRILDLLLVAYLISEILQMPLSAPLDVAIKLERGGTDESTRPRSPEDSNTVLGAFTYSWMNGIMAVARKRPLRPSDVWELALNNRAEVLSRRFSSLKSKTLTRKLLRASARDIAIDASLKLVASSSEYLRPFFIQKILENLTLAYSAHPSSPASASTWTPREKAYLYTALAFLSMLCKTLAQQRHFHYARRIGMRLRSELTVAVFEKALRRRESAGNGKERKGDKVGEGEGEEHSASVGRVISMISEDVNRVLRLGCDSHLIYGAPLEIFLGLTFLTNLMGWSALAGFAILSISAPIMFWLGQCAEEVSRHRSAARDVRQTSLQELFGDIRSIKLFGWSDAWIDRAEEKRAEELRWLIQDWTVRFFTTALWVFVSLVVPLLSFFAYVKLQGGELTVAIAFTALSLFSLIRGPLNQIPGFGIRILQLRVSIGRLESFFAENEIAEHAALLARNSAERLALRKATLRYAGAEAGKVALRDADVEFPMDRLTVVSGPTGSGKSSILLGLLGELEVISGSVELPASLSYAAQHPWLESLSVRDNILFGYVADEKRYRAVIKACALERDLEILPEGDRTFVGERGVSLSGGQKARLALARAIYAPTTHILLDDVFSAVDSNTARHLLDHLFDTSPRSSLLRGRTCVLVTHHVDLVLPYAGYHVELQDGRVVRQGPVKQGEKQVEKVEEELERMEEEEHEEADDSLAEAVPAPARTAVPKAAADARKEGWTTGEVKQEMYRTYLSSSGYLTWAITLLCLLARPAFSFLEQFWLRRWGEAAEGPEPVDSSYFLVGYALIGSATALDTLLATVFIYVASLRGSRSLFHQLLLHVVNASLRWFDVVPLGTIQNRFSNDIGIVDEALATNVSEFGGNIISMVASLTVVSIVLPAALGSSFVFAVTYFYIFRAYLSVNRDVNRIAATTASPLFSSFAEALRGIATIRAFAKQKEYRAQLCRIVDDTLAFWYLSATLDVWLSIRTQLLSAFCLLATATFATYARISPGLAGIAITSSQSVITALDFLCSAYGRLVLSMNSLERITEYLEVPQEPEGGEEPPASWPSPVGSEPLVEVKNLVVRYAPELPPVLHGVSFSVKPGEKIGIVGRTGSGKSTLASSLFRFTDPDSGSIRIAGLDITSLRLSTLRRRFTLVPQDPALFAGTLRNNLDPLSEHSDAECWDAVRRVHLVAPDAAEEDERQGGVSLETQVAAGGTNWSAGQRQLIALARALLRASPLIIMDEASAALDHALDARVQEVVQTEFADRAVLTIAHRLRIVLTCDRILVLSAGHIVELDTPAALLAKEDGVFRRMWEESGGKGGAEEVGE